MLRRLFPRWKIIVSSGFAVTYVVVFNVFAIYNLARTPVHWLGTKGQLYAGGFLSKPSCKRIRLSSKPLPITALASFPGSGNTWLRHLVQQATGKKLSICCLLYEQFSRSNDDEAVRMCCCQHYFFPQNNDLVAPR